MSDIRLFYFTSEQHRVYRWRAGKLDLEASFSADMPDLAEFSAFVNSTGRSLYYVLADIAGEDFHEEVIPSLRGGDRDAVIQRRLAQRYRDTRLAATSSLGVVPGERKNERVLLASFTNTQQFSPWLDVLAQSKARLAGVYSAPYLAPALGAKLGAKTGRIFVITVNTTGLRQSFVEDGRLRFSRLERTAELAPEALPAFVRSETLRLSQYLGSLRVLPRDGPPISALVIAPAGRAAEFEQALPSDSRITFRTLGIEDAARTTGVKQAGGSLGEQLYLNLVATQTPKAQFARQEDRRSYVIWQVQRAIIATGLAGMTACVLYAGAKWIDVMDVRGKSDILTQEATNSKREYERITATFPGTLTTTENLKATVAEFRSLADRTSFPEDALRHVAAALEQFPQIEVDNIVWRVDKAGAAKPPAAAAASPTAGATGAPSAKGPVIDLAQMLELSGSINAGQRSDYRAITAQVQRFVEAIGANGSYEIVQTQLPFDITPGGTLSGDIGESAGSDVPKFSIVIARRLTK